MPSVVFRPVAPGDIEHIAEHLRAADFAELQASRGTSNPDIEAILRESVAMSAYARVAVARDGEPLCVFGLVTTDEFGVPWLLGTERTYTFSKTFLSAAYAVLEEMRGIRAYLFNYVDVRNEASVRWLERLGFSIRPPEPFGKAGLPFHRFEIGGNGVRA